MMEMLLLMIIGHGIADYPLQGDWLSKAKNHKIELIKGESIWFMALLQHSSIHAGAVWLASGSWMLAFFEFVTHSIIDHAKCDGEIGYNMDQALHIISKFVWVGIYYIAIV